MGHGRQVSYAGLVICRQRPGTAAGVVFMILEDETGFVNLVVWSKVFERFRNTILSASFLDVSGTIQSQHSVVHIIAARFWAMEWSADQTAEPTTGCNGDPAPGARRPLPLRSPRLPLTPVVANVCQRPLASWAGGLVVFDNVVRC